MVSGHVVGKGKEDADKEQRREKRASVSGRVEEKGKEDAIFNDACEQLALSL